MLVHDHPLLEVPLGKRCVLLAERALHASRVIRAPVRVRPSRPNRGGGRFVAQGARHRGAKLLLIVTVVVREGVTEDDDAVRSALRDGAPITNEPRLA